MVKRNSIQAKTIAAKQNTPTSCIWPVAGAVVKNPPANAGAKGSIPGSRQSPGDGNGNPCQYSCLGNPMDRGDWTHPTVGHVPQTVRHVRQSDMTKQAGRLSLQEKLLRF